ncbi:MAG: hypothetical protein SWK76_05575 [Actinomycetota bacterium]|nr:hypothetical protein [Actinomycetota bacterium]
MARGLGAEEGQIWTYIIKIALVFLVLGILVIQFGPIIWNQISTRYTARDASDLAATTFNNNRGDMDKVYEKVEEMLTDREARLDGNISIIYDQAGQPSAISVPVRKIVNTYLFENVSYLSSLTEACSVGESNLE